MIRRALTMLVVLAAFSGLAGAASIAEKEPTPKTRGKVFEWKSKDGLAYRFFVPKNYDEEKGANLTLILHGSNLDRRWGFANHKAGDFRPDDIVVSPDGTSPNGRGGFNFMGKSADADRLHALVEELKKTFRIRGLYLYGHSQGSFFALYYAGEYPKEVNGLVAHASGLWNWTQRGPKGHHQAIVFMHGTQDPVVPYSQSVGGYEVLRDARYPMVRLVSLEGWNHWPAEHNGPVPHTSQELAWCEGMTTDDPERLAVCLDFLRDNKSRERHDYAALYSLAKRIEGMKDVSDDLRGQAARAAEAVAELAANHVKALDLPDDLELEKEAWVGHLPVFLRAFIGVPAREELAEKLEKTLSRQTKVAIKHLREYYQKRGKKPADAFEAGVAAIRDGFLYAGCADRAFLETLEKWNKDAKDLRLSRKALKQYAETVPALRKAIEEGYREFDAVNRKVGKL